MKLAAERPTDDMMLKDAIDAFAAAYDGQGEMQIECFAPVEYPHGMKRDQTYWGATIDGAVGLGIELRYNPASRRFRITAVGQMPPEMAAAMGVFGSRVLLYERHVTVLLDEAGTVPELADYLLEKYPARRLAAA